MFSTAQAMPLVGYAIGDRGGLLDTPDALARAAIGTRPGPGDEWPLLDLFGRTLFSVSYYGANVYPETVAPVLEAPEIAEAVTGRFVLQVREMNGESRLVVVVERAPGDPRPVGAGRLAGLIASRLVAVNSEYRQYVSPGRQVPLVEPREHQDPVWFPAGVKHRYTR